MTQDSVEVDLPNGKKGKATRVDVAQSNERWSEFTLPDGTKLLAKVSLISVMRVENELDVGGNPLYMINAVPTLIVENPAKPAVTEP
jgi:hypothetical protein